MLRFTGIIIIDINNNKYVLLVHESTNVCSQNDILHAKGKADWSMKDIQINTVKSKIACIWDPKL